MLESPLLEAVLCEKNDGRQRHGTEKKHIYNPIYNHFISANIPLYIPLYVYIYIHIR